MSGQPWLSGISRISAPGMAQPCTGQNLIPVLHGAESARLLAFPIKGVVRDGTERCHAAASSNQARQKDNARFSELIPQESTRDDLTAGECRLNIRLARLQVGHLNMAGQARIHADKPGCGRVTHAVCRGCRICLDVSSNSLLQPRLNLYLSVPKAVEKHRGAARAACEPFTVQQSHAFISCLLHS